MPGRDEANLMPAGSVHKIVALLPLMRTLVWTVERSCARLVPEPTAVPIPRRLSEEVLMGNISIAQLATK